MLTKPLINQHVDVPVAQLSRSKRFYQSLGFKLVMSSPFFYEGYEGQIAMMRSGNMVIELYQLPEQAGQPDQLGPDNPIAVPVTCVDTTFAQLQKQGHSPVEASPLSQAFRSGEYRYFTVVGPDGEHIEFCQTVA